MKRRFQFTLIIAVIWFVLGFLAVEAWISFRSQNTDSPVSAASSGGASSGAASSSHAPASSGRASSGATSSRAASGSSSLPSISDPAPLLSLEPRPEGIDPDGIIALRIIDISHHNTVTDWSAVKNNTDGLYIKATEGSAFVDPAFEKYASGAGKAGIPLGFYHYFQPSSSAKYIKQQASHFYSVIKKYNYQFIPVLDIEESNGLSPDKVAANVDTFLKEFQKISGQRIMFYCSPAYANKYLNEKAFASYPLWIANYNVNAPRKPIIWNAFCVWQYGTTVTVPGIQGQVDGDIATTTIYLDKNKVPKE